MRCQDCGGRCRPYESRCQFSRLRLPDPRSRPLARQATFARFGRSDRRAQASRASTLRWRRAHHEPRPPHGLASPSHPAPRGEHLRPLCGGHCPPYHFFGANRSTREYGRVAVAEIVQMAQGDMTFGSGPSQDPDPQRNCSPQWCAFCARKRDVGPTPTTHACPYGLTGGPGRHRSDARPHRSTCKSPHRPRRPSSSSRRHRPESARRSRRERPPG